MPYDSFQLESLKNIVLKDCVMKQIDRHLIGYRYKEYI